MKKLWKIVLLLLPALLFSFAAHAELTVHFLPTGQSEAILIRCDGEDMMIDSGRLNAEKTVEAYLKKQGVSKLKYFVCSHRHSDHIASAAGIIYTHKPQCVFCLGAEEETVVLTRAKSRGTSVYNAVRNTPFEYLDLDDTFTIGGATVQVIGPVPLIRRLGRRTETDKVYENANSLVLKITYGETTFLFPGDASENTLREIEKRQPGILKTDVYMNAYHKTAISEDLADRIAPKICVFFWDDPKTPDADYLNLLKKYNTQLYQASKQISGAVVVTSDGKNLTVSTQNGAQTLSVKKTAITLKQGCTETLSLQPSKIASFANVCWTSDDPCIATVSNSGTITGIAQGTTTIRAYCDGAYKIDAAIKVTVLQQNASFRTKKIKLQGMQSKKLSLTGVSKNTNCRFVSSDSSVATVSASGFVTAVGEGDCEIALWIGECYQDTCAVTVTSVAPKKISLSGKSTVRTGETITLSITTSPSKATIGTCEWTSSAENIASVDENGVVTGLCQGKATISCTCGTLKARKTITVSAPATKAIDIVPYSQTVYLQTGDVRFYAFEGKVNPSLVDVTWSSSAKTVASIDENGLLTPLSPGKTTITATRKQGRGTKSITITVQKNIFERKKPSEKSNSVRISAKSMRYEEGTLSVDLFVSNKSKQIYTLPEESVLLFTMPTGAIRKIPVHFTEIGTQIGVKQVGVVHCELSLSEYPFLKNLALPKCDFTN